MLIIGLGHRARQGKDTVAKFIAEQYHDKYNIKVYSFAQVLKDEVNRLYEDNDKDWSKTFGYIHHNLQELPVWVSVEHSPDMTDPLCPYGKQRTLLQWYGTEFRRNKQPNYWVKELAKRIAKDKDSVDVGIVTDMRFPNEFQWIKSFGRDGVTLKVERVGHEENGVNAAHISENALNGYEFDYTIQASSLQELREDAKTFFDMMIERDNLPDGFKDFKVGE